MCKKVMYVSSLYGYNMFRIAGIKHFKPTLTAEVNVSEIYDLSFLLDWTKTKKRHREENNIWNTKHEKKTTKQSERKLKQIGKEQDLFFLKQKKLSCDMCL